MKLVIESNLLNISGGVQRPCYSSWSMTLTYNVLKGGLIGLVVAPSEHCFKGMIIGSFVGAGIAFWNAVAADANICVEHTAQ